MERTARGVPKGYARGVAVVTVAGRRSNGSREQTLLGARTKHCLEGEREGCAVMHATDGNGWDR